MKTLAVIGASYLQRPLVEKAKEMGLRVICFAWAKDAVCSDISDRFYPISIVEKEHILSICRHEKIDGICTIASDVAAPTVAFVANQLHLNGNRYDAAVKANNKYLMRQAFSHAGINCPRYIRIGADNDSVDFSTWSFPLIVKPCDRSGSLGVVLAYNPYELQKGLASARALSFQHEAIIEEFVDGREISVEFISYHGKHFPLTITDKITTGAPHFVELEHHQPANITPEQYENVYCLTRTALDSLGITEGASHAEYKITDNGEIYIIELGARMGGDFIGSDLVFLSTGYDFVKGVIEVALGEFKEPTVTSLAYSGVYFLSKETERLFPLFIHPERVPGVVKASLIDTSLRQAQCSADRSGYIIYQSDNKISL